MVEKQIEYLGDLRFSAEEILYLHRVLPQLPSDYLEYLADFKLVPSSQIKYLDNDEGTLN